MKITIELSIEDWRKYHKYLSKRLSASVKTFSNSFLFNVILWMILVLIFMFVLRHFEDFHVPTAGLVLGIISCLVIWVYFYNKKYIKAFEPKTNGSFLGTHNFEFDEWGIHSYGDNYDAKHSWNVVQEIQRDSGLIIIFVDTVMAFIFPEEKLNDPDNFYKIVSNMFEYNHSLKRAAKNAVTPLA